VLSSLSNQDFVANKKKLPHPEKMRQRYLG